MKKKKNQRIEGRGQQDNEMVQLLKRKELNNNKRK